MQIKSITLGSYRRAKQCIAEIENQKDAKRHLNYLMMDGEEWRANHDQS